MSENKVEHIVQDNQAALGAPAGEIERALMRLSCDLTTAIFLGDYASALRITALIRDGITNREAALQEDSREERGNHVRVEQT